MSTPTRAPSRPIRLTRRGVVVIAALLAVAVLIVIVALAADHLSRPAGVYGSTLALAPGTLAVVGLLLWAER